VIGITNRSRTARRLGVRIVAAAILLCLSLVPSLARAHDRLDEQRTPAQEHSRFRWTNSCESVPQKVLTVATVAPAETPAPIAVDQPARAWRVPPTEAPRPGSSPLITSHGLRAPPAHSTDSAR
jgi:hypothetical protein